MLYNQIKFNVSKITNKLGISVIPNEIKSQLNYLNIVNPAGISVSNESRIKAALEWIYLAQDHSLTADGGVARHYHIKTGWGASYPETTGYIIPTLINYFNLYNDKNSLQRSIKMLDWLLSIQFSNGAFQGGMVNETPRMPVVFNTGQILFGLAAGAKQFGEPYTTAARKAANWLVEVQDKDGCWRKFSSPFAECGEKVYDTHVAWALLEAARVLKTEKYSIAAQKNIDWALSKQQASGWFESCCLNEPNKPLTHTIGYALRGVLEGYLFFEDPNYLDACKKAADSLCSCIKDDGFLSGRINCHWKGSKKWSCLTGNVQIAYCIMKLYQITNNKLYLQKALLLNQYTKSTQLLDSSKKHFIGGIKGSHPMQAEYGQYEYLNWAAKFYIDSLLLESQLQDMQ